MARVMKHPWVTKRGQWQLRSVREMMKEHGRVVDNEEPELPDLMSTYNVLDVPRQVSWWINPLETLNYISSPRIAILQFSCFLAEAHLGGHQHSWDEHLGWASRLQIQCNLKHSSLGHHRPVHTAFLKLLIGLSQSRTTCWTCFARICQSAASGMATSCCVRASRAPTSCTCCKARWRSSSSCSHCGSRG